MPIRTVKRKKKQKGLELTEESDYDLFDDIKVNEAFQMVKKSRLIEKNKSVEDHEEV